jgi:hypothetical protein
MECSATADRLGLGLVGLEGDALGSSALLARNRDNQLFLGLGRRQGAIITYNASDMILQVHSDAGYANEKGA